LALAPSELVHAIMEPPMTMRAETPDRSARQTHRPKTSKERALINPADLDAILLDLDGVVTETAETHACAWKATFDEYLRRCRGRGATSALLDKMQAADVTLM